ncbi:MAG: 30S ribosomal protein S4 [Spirochaetes bacterium GWF1_49_6]|jgi:small subunit ribosomal protein S4|nr:MAG: 30S ribosomal protein S4 [Spirochaetes bacterium GWF1_49_6]
MGRYTDASCRQCRREGVRLFLKGDRCYTAKCAVTKRKTPPGMIPKFRKKPTEYAVQLREKQKVKRYYGLLERQFRKYFETASQLKGITGILLLQILERRLDNVVYRVGFAASRKAARQFVGHGHIQINGKKVDIPSYLLKIGDVITLADKGAKMTIVDEALSKVENRVVPVWLEADYKKKSVKVLHIPEKAEMALEVEINEPLIVELYSK